MRKNLNLFSALTSLLIAQNNSFSLSDKCDKTGVKYISINFSRKNI